MVLFILKVKLADRFDPSGEHLTASFRSRRILIINFFNWELLDDQCEKGTSEAV
jgi:hypothetical protein